MPLPPQSSEIPLPYWIEIIIEHLFVIGKSESKTLYMTMVRSKFRLNSALVRLIRRGQAELGRTAMPAFLSGRAQGGSEFLDECVVAARIAADERPEDGFHAFIGPGFQAIRGLTVQETTMIHENAPLKDGVAGNGRPAWVDVAHTLPC